MYDVTVNVDRALARLGRMPDAIRASLKSEINTLSVDLRDKSRGLAGALFQVRSGKFVKSIKKSVRSSKTAVLGKVYSSDPVAHLLERGVRPHDIRPKQGTKALAFMGRFGEVVHHPGFKGHTIINAAYQGMKDDITAGIIQAVKDGVKIDASTADPSVAGD